MKEIIKRLAKILAILGIVALTIFYVPVIRDFWKSFADWVLDFGEWGIVAVTGCIFYTVLSIFMD